MLEFGGFVACEKWVRAYYRKSYGDYSFPEFSPADVKTFIEDELQARRFSGVILARKKHSALLTTLRPRP